MSEERALIARAVRGEAEALGTLVAEHRPTVVRAARHLLGDPAEAEDAAHDVFLRMQASLPRFRGDAELATWLYRVTLNVCRDRHRRSRVRRSEVDLAAEPDAPALRVESGVERELDVARARAAVREAIDRLPAEQREAVLLRFVDDLPYAEIARVTGAPPGTVASRVFRALQRIGSDLEPRHLEVVK